jgi:hypothetical protein
LQTQSSTNLAVKSGPFTDNQFDNLAHNFVPSQIALKVISVSVSLSGEILRNLEKLAAKSGPFTDNQFDNMAHNFVRSQIALLNNFRQQLKQLSRSARYCVCLKAKVRIRALKPVFLGKLIFLRS